CRLETSAAQHGDFYLLCSDGLYNLVSCSEILQIVSRNTPQKAVDALVVLANERGGTDNITVILVSVGTTAGRSEDGEDADAEDHSSTSTLELNDTLELCQERDFNIPLGYGSNRESGFATGNSEASACTGVRSDSPEIRANVDAEGLASEILNQEAAKRAAAATSAASQAEPEPTEIAEEAPKSLLLQGWGVVVLVLTFSALGFMIGGYFSGREGGFDPGPGVVPPDLEVALSSNHAENRVEITKKEGAKKEGALNLQEGVRLEAGADVSEISPKKISPERVETKQSPVFEDPETEVPASVDSEPQFSRLIDVDSEAGKMLPEKTEEEELDPEPLEDKVDPMDSYVQGLDDSEIANIEKRKLMLSKEISVLNDQIQSFTMPISGATNQLLRQTTEEMEELVKSRDKVKSELDIASRKLGVWYGRRERLRTTDSLKLATEVAAVSEAVRQKQEAFQQVTWQYLKEAEVLSYDPANLEQKKKVSDLMRQRKERMSELSNEVQQVISDEVGRADRILAELTIKLSALETQLDDKRKDLEYAQALFSPDSNLKDRKKQELQIRREALVTELEELRQLQPD
ncbi:MAG: hypothetical protein GX589_03900, partial [Deltaproteobacteria bacterium]|nr:hypothetical protein [Deltaproteobacteria bacterium]